MPHSPPGRAPLPQRESVARFPPLKSLQSPYQGAAYERNGKPQTKAWIALSEKALAFDARLQRGAAIEIGEPAAQAEVFQHELIVGVGEVTLGPARVRKQCKAHIEAFLVDDQHATAIRVAFVDIALAFDGLAV